MKLAKYVSILIMSCVFHIQPIVSFSKQYRSGYVKDIGVTLRRMLSMTLIGCGLECNSYTECNGFRFNIPGDKYLTCYLQKLPLIREKGSHMIYIRVELVGYVVAPCRIKLWEGGKLPHQQKERDDWRKAGIPFKISKSPKLVAFKFSRFQKIRVTNRNMAFLAAFEGGKLSSRNETSKWSWKCLVQTPANHGWRKKIDYNIDLENWTIPLTQYANKQSNRQDYPFVKEIYDVDSKAEYVWVDKQGTELEKLYCRVIIT